MESVKRYCISQLGSGMEEMEEGPWVCGSDFDLVLAERNAFRDEARRLASLFDDLSKRVGFSEERCQQTGESPGDCADVLRADFDRIKAEREALQLMLNNRDELDDQLTSLEQRRYAEQQAREAAERDAERYRWLRKVTPYRFKKIQDAAVTDGGDVMYFHADRFDNAVDAAMEPALNPTAEAVSHE